MVENLSYKLREFLKSAQGKNVTLDYIRRELKINPDSPAYDGIRVLMFNCVKEKLVRRDGKNDGTFKVVTQVEPIQVFGTLRERRPPFTLMFPRDRNTEMEMDFANDVIMREGDIVLISGQSNFGKTALCMNFCGENIDLMPVLMGNEYSTLVTNHLPDSLIG